MTAGRIAGLEAAFNRLTNKYNFARQNEGNYAEVARLVALQQQVYSNKQSMTLQSYGQYLKTANQQDLIEYDINLKRQADRAPQQTFGPQFHYGMGAVPMTSTVGIVASTQTQHRAAQGTNMK